MADVWALYRWQPSFVLGFHGTDKSVVDAVVAQPGKGLKKSENKTEWLGQGVYFWEHDPARALDWAANGKKNHIQVCVINTKSCIKGYFKPIQTAQ